MRCILLGILLFSLGAQAQDLVRQTLGSAGVSLEANIGPQRYFLWQSIGQGSVIETFTAESYRLRQGYIQPLGPAALGETPFGLELSFYPNPFVEQLTIDFEREPVERIALMFFDMLGRQVFAQEYDQASRITVDTRTLSSGGYLLTVRSGVLRNVKQVIKL